MGVQVSDKEKIDRVALYEEVRFYKRQQWAVVTAGVALLGALLATVRGVHMTELERYLAVVLIVVGVCAGVYFLDSLQKALAAVREIAPELTGHGLPFSKCEAYNRVYDQFYQSR
jgi:hypothetical protein